MSSWLTSTVPAVLIQPLPQPPTAMCSTAGLTDVENRGSIDPCTFELIRRRRRVSAFEVAGETSSRLKARPSVTSEVTEFVSAIGLLPGAKRPPSQLDAYTFAPQDVPGAIQGIIAAFENLIEQSTGQQLAGPPTWQTDPSATRCL